MARKFWTCPCGTRNERTKQKCANEGCRRSRPKARVPKHAVALRDLTYDDYIAVNQTIHGVGDVCAVCGRERSQERKLDREHGHHQGELSYGKPRGLVCVADNILMPRGLTAAKAQEIAAYLARVDDTT
jgi:hypothetical protein